MAYPRPFGSRVIPILSMGGGLTRRRGNSTTLLHNTQTDEVGKNAATKTTGLADARSSCQSAVRHQKVESQTLNKHSNDERR